MRRSWNGSVVSTITRGLVALPDQCRPIANNRIVVAGNLSRRCVAHHADLVGAKAARGPQRRRQRAAPASHSCTRYDDTMQLKRRQLLQHRRIQRLRSRRG